MVDEKTHQEQTSNKKKNPLLLTALAVVAFVLLLVMMMYLGNRLVNIEDQLSYRPPSITQKPASDSYGIDIVEGQTVYVPVYSHIYAEGGEPHLLETTVSIRNSDPQRAINVTSARYFDTKGTLIQEYVEGRLPLGPLESAEFLVEKRDVRGGSGANFIVVWSSEEPVYEPIIEAVMIGQSKNQSISFKSVGRPLAQRVE